MNSQLVKFLLIIGALAVSAWFFVAFPMNLGLDLQGGTRLILEAQDTATAKVDNDALTGTLDVIRTRVDSLGVSEPIIRRKGTRQIIVELPGIKDPERAIKLIGETALLEFIEAEWAPGSAKDMTPDKVVLLAGEGAKLALVQDFDKDGKLVQERPIILKKTALTGADLKIASPGTNQYNQPVVNIEFSDLGAQKFKDVTTKEVGKPLAIVLDGKIISAPNINEPIAGGKAQISGHFSPQDMRELVIKLKAGSLPVPVKIASKTVVGPTLGRDSIEKSKVAGCVGLALIVLFLVVYYRLAGVVASTALFIYIFLCLASLKGFHATLTLTGIAGLVLSIGMAVDANIIIFERIKEERKAGFPIATAIKTGFSRAFVTVLDANVSTLISAGVLFWLGTGTIRGFAVTLTIGVVISMFTAVLVTRVFLDTLINRSKDPESLFFKVKS